MQCDRNLYKYIFLEFTALSVCLSVEKDIGGIGVSNDELPARTP